MSYRSVNGVPVWFGAIVVNGFTNELLGHVDDGDSPWEDGVEAYVQVTRLDGSEESWCCGHLNILGYTRDA